MYKSKERDIKRKIHLTGCVEAFVGAAALYAVGTAIIGQSPAAYAADVMPADAAGLGLGIYRCAGDLGATVTLASHKSIQNPFSSC